MEGCNFHDDPGILGWIRNRDNHLISKKLVELNVALRSHSDMLLNSRLVESEQDIEGSSRITHFGMPRRVRRIFTAGTSRFDPTHPNKVQATLWKSEWIRDPSKRTGVV